VLRRLHRIVVSASSHHPYEATTSLYRAVEAGGTCRLYRGARRNIEVRSATAELRDSASFHPVPVGEAMGTNSARDYMRARQTFRKVVENGPADIGMDVRVFVYIDPSVQSEFSHTYIARADASVTDAHTGGAIAHYSGFGKATGQGSKDSKEASEGLTRKSVRAALNDLFSKIETDTRLVPH
jgi:hypothetical protein